MRVYVGLEIFLWKKRRSLQRYFEARPFAPVVKMRALHLGANAMHHAGAYLTAALQCAGDLLRATDLRIPAIYPFRDYAGAGLLTLYVFDPGGSDSAGADSPHADTREINTVTTVLGDFVGNIVAAERSTSLPRAAYGEPKPRPARKIMSTDRP
jgi:hypothetical protein